MLQINKINKHEVEVATKDKDGQTWFSYFTDEEAFEVFRDAIAQELVDQL